MASSKDIESIRREKYSPVIKKLTKVLDLITDSPVPINIVAYCKDGETIADKDPDRISIHFLGENAKQIKDLIITVLKSSKNEFSSTYLPQSYQEELLSDHKIDFDPSKLVKLKNSDFEKAINDIVSMKTTYRFINNRDIPSPSKFI